MVSGEWWVVWMRGVRSDDRLVQAGVYLEHCVYLPLANRQPARVHCLPKAWDLYNTPEEREKATQESMGGERSLVGVPEGFDAEQRNGLHQAGQTEA